MGNRQQSRFLALVGNYDEYSKALEVAANAEDAGTLQYLKTMDSIETKLQQVKTAWTQLYSSMGLEKLFKGALDITTKILQNFNKLGKANALMNLFTILKGAKTLINGVFQLANSQISKISEKIRNDLSKATHAKIVLEHEEADKVISNIGINLRNAVNLNSPAQPSARDTLLSKLSGIKNTDFYKGRATSNSLNQGIGQLDPNVIASSNLASEKQLNLTADEIAEYQKLFKESGLEQIKTADGLIDALLKLSKASNSTSDAINKTPPALIKFKNLVVSHTVEIGSALSILGSVITTAAMTIKDTSNSGAEWSKVVSGGGNLLSAAGTGFTTFAMTGGNVPLALLTAAPQLISGIAQMIDGSIITTKERIEMLTNELEDLKNEAVIKKGTTNDLKSTLNELNELAEAQYDSAEASQAYKDKMNEIAEKYPELVKEYDSVGNAIIDATKMEQMLAESRIKTAKATADAAEGELKLKEEEKTRVEEAQALLEEPIIKKYTGSIVLNGGTDNLGIQDLESLYNQDIFKDLIYKDSFLGSSYYQLTDEGYQVLNNLISKITEEGIGNLSEIELQMAKSVGFIKDNNILSLGTLFTQADDMSYAQSDVALKDIKQEDIETGRIDIKQIIDSINSILNNLGEEYEGLSAESYFNISTESTPEEIIAAIEAFNQLVEGNLNETADGVSKYTEDLLKLRTSEKIAEKASLDFGKKQSEILTEYSSGFSTIVAEMVKNSLGETSLEDADTETLNAERDKALDAIYTWLKMADKETVSQFMDILDNPDAYRSESELKDDIDDFTSDADITKAIISYYNDSIEATRKRFFDSIEANTKTQEDDLFSNFEYLFNGEIDDAEIGELTSQYVNGLIGTFNKISDYYKNGLKVSASSLAGSAYDVYSQISLLDSDIQTDLSYALSNLDLTDSLSIQSAIDLINNYSESNPNVNLEPLLKSLITAKDNLAFNLTVQFENWKDDIIGSTEKIKSTIGNLTDGMELEEAYEAFKSITSKEENADLSFDALFRFDTTLGKWVYTQEGFSKAIANTEEELNNSYKEADDKYNRYVNNLNEALINQLASSDELFNNGVLNNDALNKILSDANITDEAFIKTLEQDLLAFDPEQGILLEDYLADLLNKYAIYAQQAIALQNASIAQRLADYAEALDFTKIGNGTLSDNDVEVIRAAAEEVGANEELFNKAIAGDLDALAPIFEESFTQERRTAVIKGNVDKYNTALNELLSEPNTILSDTTIELLNNNAFYHDLIGKNGELLIDNTAALGFAIVDLYNNLKKQIGVTVEEINAQALAMASKNLGLDKISSTQDLLSYELDLNSLNNFANAHGAYLDSFFNEEMNAINKGFADVLSIDSNTGSIKVLDFNAFVARLEDTFNIVIDKTSKEYLDAYSNYLEDKIASDSAISQGVQNELQSIFDAGIGDKVVVPYLQSIVNNLKDFGFDVKEGYVEITGAEDIFGLIKEIQESGNQELLGNLAQLNDSLAELLNSYTSIISAGIEGSMDYEGAEKLQSFLGDRVNIQYTRTENGLKLTQQSAYEVYQELLKIDAISSNIVLTGLVESAADGNEQLNDIYYVLEKIDTLNKEISQAEPGTAREKQLRTELAITEQIRNNLMEDGDAFNFMDRDVPTAFTNPLSAWEGMGTAFDVLDSEDFQNGRIKFQDFYNMITMMGDDVLRSAGIFTDDAQTASELIQAGAAALTNIDGETFVDLSKLGTDFNLGAEGMKEGLTDGIHTLAENQIDLIDAEISFLESIVKTQEVFNSLEMTEDGVIDLSEFEPIKNPDGSLEWGEESVKVLTELQTYLGEVEIEGVKISELLEDPEKFKEIDADKFIAFLNSYYQLLNSDLWDKGNNGKLLQDLFNSYFSTPIVFDPSKLAENITFESTEGGGYVKDKVEEKLIEVIGKDNWTNMGEEVTNDLVEKITQALNNGEQLSPQDLLQDFIPEDFKDDVTTYLNNTLRASNVDEVPVEIEADVSFNSKEGSLLSAVKGKVDAAKRLLQNGLTLNANTNTTETFSVDTSGITTALSELGDAFSTLQSTISTLKGEIEDIPDKSENVKKTAEQMDKLPDKSKNVRNTALAITSLKDKSSAVRNTANAIDKLKSKTITASIKVNVNAPNPSSFSTTTKIIPLNQAKGNVALAKGTLMGELGPELVVSGGRYYVVGQNGAEFVDLADDAIVFNHLQTKKLLGNGKLNGTGEPVTNEKKATSLASGNAMASASDALNQLRELRAMWTALLDASASDLGKKAGSGGGGGGGGGGGSGEETLAYIHDLERWYNLLRQIEKYEEQINYQQAKRENILSGYDYVGSLEKELEILEKQRKAYQDLSSLQKDYYDKRRKDLLSTDYSLVFTYDEEGLMQYVDGKNRGLDILATLNETDVNGKAVRNATQQLQYLKSVGFNTSVLEKNAEGTQAEKDEDRIQNFWDGVDSWMEELDDLYDSYNEAATNVEEATNKINDILQEYIDNQLEVEKKLLQAIEDREQAEIDRITDEKEQLEEAAKAYIDGLSDTLEKERNLYSKNETEQETAKLQRQLAILQRSGGSAAEIRSLQDQIDSRLKDSYFEKQQEQIDAIQEASDNQINKLQEQIDIMTETLEYQKENGLLWQEVYDMMNNWTPENMLQFIEEYTKSYQENSALQNEEDSKQALKELEIWAAKRDSDASDKAWNDYYDNLTGISDEIKKSYASEAESAFRAAYSSSGAEGAKAAADAIFSNAQSSKESADKQEDAMTTVTQPSQPTESVSTASIKRTLKDGNVYLRKGANTNSSNLGLIKKGTNVELSGISRNKNDGYYWFKATANGKTGYMAYTSHWGTIPQSELDKLPKFKQGGLIDFTGPAWVDGSKSKPESILSAEDTAMLKSKIFGNSNSSIKALVAAIETINSDTSKYSSVNSSTEQIVIEKAEVNIQPGVISNDYEAKRAGEMALEQMVKIARKTGKQSVRR